MFGLNKDLLNGMSQHMLSGGDEKFLILLGCGALALFAGLRVARSVFTAPRPARAAYEDHGLRGAMDEDASAVTAESLRSVESRLREADLPGAEIELRLQDATVVLARLRRRLSVAAPDALALVDRGDFEAASTLLKQRRQQALAPGEAPGDQGDIRQEAEIYADAALIDHLSLDYRGAAEAFAAAAALAAKLGGEASNSYDEWRFRMEQAHALVGDGRQTGDSESFANAIETYDRALTLVSRAQAPFVWAATQFHRGDALLASGVNDNLRGRVEEAVDSYRAALEEWTPRSSPFDWARTQHNLGDALQRLAEMESGIERLQPATEAYRAALQEWTREAAPSLFAMAQGSLGDALATLGARSGDKKKLREAIAAYRAALSETRREFAPEQWALMQNSLGNALEALAEQEFREQLYGPEQLRQAIEAFESALEVRTAETSPTEFASTSVSLGDALLALGEHESVENPAYGADLLQRAAAAYRGALASSAGRAPVDLAKIEINLAYALGLTWNLTRDRRMLDEALTLLDAAILVIKETDEQKHIGDAEQARRTILDALQHAA